MPRGGEDVPSVRQTPAELQAKAAHWRELARKLAHDPAYKRIIEFADELEAQASELEMSLKPDAADP